eukprot:187840-Pelagomonas_calceolata.AAC.1
MWTLLQVLLAVARAGTCTLHIFPGTDLGQVSPIYKGKAVCEYSPKIKQIRFIFAGISFMLQLSSQA